MHSKNKGNIAEAAVLLELQKHDISTFREIGDNSRIDIIAEKKGVLRRIQVKYSSSRSDSLSVQVNKSGPNGYRYTYSSNDIDWFAVYHPEHQKIAWVKIDEALINKNGILIRFTPTKNGQKKGIHFIEDYSIENFINDLNLSI